MVINNTLFNITPTQEIPNSCINWCIQQITTHNTNTTINALFLPATAIITLSIIGILDYHNEWFTRKNPNLTPEILYSVIFGLRILTITLLIGFLTYNYIILK